LRSNGLRVPFLFSALQALTQFAKSSEGCLVIKGAPRRENDKMLGNHTRKIHFLAWKIAKEKYCAVIENWLIRY
jgi:hypothetical protein